MSTEHYLNKCADNEFEAKKKLVEKYGGRTPDGPDYVRIAQQQKDNAQSAAAPRHELDLTFDLSVERIRRIGTLLRKSSSINEFGTAEAIAFMQLFGDQLQEKLNEILRDFVKDKLKRY